MTENVPKHKINQAKWYELDSYQLMKLLFPAEWLPINMTLIFFRGASNVRPMFAAMWINPTQFTTAK